MAISHPFLGQIERLRCLFTDFDGDPIDPSTVSVRIVRPDGSIVVYNDPTNDPTTPEGDGVFYKDVTMSQVGDWHVRWESTGGLNPITQYTVAVRPVESGSVAVGVSDSSPSGP